MPRRNVGSTTTEMRFANCDWSTWRARTSRCQPRGGGGVLFAVLREGVSLVRLLEVFLCFFRWCRVCSC